jgi:hypothetical protein
MRVFIVFVYDIGCNGLTPPPRHTTCLEEKPAIFNQSDYPANRFLIARMNRLPPLPGGHWFIRCNASAVQGITGSAQ